MPGATRQGGDANDVVLETSERTKGARCSELDLPGLTSPFACRALPDGLRSADSAWSIIRARVSGPLRIGATTARVPSAIVPEPSPDRQRNAINSRAKLSPRTALNALAVGHTLWGTYAYRDQLAGIVADVPGSVGDGIFDKEHSRDARAAAYWFLFVGPLLTVIARLYDSAETAGDRPAMRSAARILLGTSVAGLVTIPRSGFPGGIALGLWLMRRAGRARPE